MATVGLLRTGIVCSVIAFIFMFIAFASPYWYQSWRRVHSSFANIGLWHICLEGYIMPRDPVMKSYVGCWWIHSTEFDLVEMQIMPVWFRFVQAFAVFTLVADLFAMIFTILYIPVGPRSRLYKKRPRMFFINSALLLGAAFLVFLISLVFAEMSNDSSWMPRPWMNYLSWSYGLCVVSGFFSAFGGISLFVLGLVYADKEANGDPGVTSAAELAAKQRELEKQDEAMRTQQGSIPMSQTAGAYGSKGSLNYRAGPAPPYGSRGALSHQGGRSGMVPSHHGSQASSMTGGPPYRGAYHRGQAPSHHGSQASSMTGGPPHRGAYHRGQAPSHHGSQASSITGAAPYRSTGQPARAEREPSETGSQSTRVGESFV